MSEENLKARAVLLYAHTIEEKVPSRSAWPKREPKDTTFRTRTYTLWLPFPPEKK